MPDLTCDRCGVIETINTKSDEKFGQRAAALGWLIGLPHGWQWCPKCADPRLRSRKVSP